MAREGKIGSNETARALAAAAALAAAGALGASACGGGQTYGTAFDPQWTNDDGAGIAAFQQQVASMQVPAGADAVVGIAGTSTLVGVPLEGGTPWKLQHAIEGRPALAGQVVVGVGAGELFALDARSGTLLWKRPAGGRLKGIGDDGKTTVVSLLPETGRGSTVLAIARDGSVIRQIEDEARIGVPAVVGDFAFLPWQGQYVTAYDLVSGEEKARALLRAQTSHAFVSGGAIFFAEAGVTRFDENIRQAHLGQASTLNLPARELPGVPRWFSAGTDALALRTTANDKIRLYARLEPQGPAGIDSGRFVATYYRIAVGLDAKSGALAWVHAHEDADFVGGAAYAGGFALCDTAGKVTFLDAKTGGVAGSTSLGQPVDLCLVQADELTKRFGGTMPPLTEQLAAAVKMPQAEHVMIQKLLLREMAGRPDESVTRTLIELASSERTPPLLLDEARKWLAARRTGISFMLDALARHYDFLADVLRPPPVGPLADALAAAGEKKAAPLLAAHLLDPATTPEDVKRAAAALATLGGAGEVSALKTFFAHYRGLGDEEPLRDAVVIVAQALVKNGAADVVSAALADPYTHETIKPRLPGFGKK